LNGLPFIFSISASAVPMRMPFALAQAD